MLIVPTLAEPSQNFTVLLETQQVEITLRTMADFLFMDLKSNGQEVVGDVICQNLNRIVRNKYFGFSGDFVFLDNYGEDVDPLFLGLGTRFSLVYLSPADLAAI